MIILYEICNWMTGLMLLLWGHWSVSHVCDIKHVCVALDRVTPVSSAYLELWEKRLVHTYTRVHTFWRKLVKHVLDTHTTLRRGMRSWCIRECFPVTEVWRKPLLGDFLCHIRLKKMIGKPSLGQKANSIFSCSFSHLTGALLFWIFDCVCFLYQGLYFPGLSLSSSLSSRHPPLIKHPPPGR